MAEQTVSTADAGAIIAALRVRVVRAGLAISALLLVVYAAVALRSGRLDDPSIWAPLAALAVGLVALLAVPWRSALERPIGDALILLWAVGLAAGLVAASQLRDQPPLVVGYAAILVLTAATMPPPRFQLVSTAAVGIGYLVDLSRSEGDSSAGEIAIQLIAIALVGLLTIVLAAAIHRHLVATARRLAELREREIELRVREADLTQLYAVSRTIGAGSNLEEVLPELVGRIAQAVGARVGVVLFYAPQQQGLEVVSPIWASGHALRAEGYLLPLTEASFAQRVFIHSDGMLSNDADEVAADPLMADLAAEKVAVVPLRLEAHTMGVLAVTDKRDGEFTQEDLETLESLAAPAALVLDHLARYQEAQEHGLKMTELARLKTDFVSVVSHELRTPLTSIIGSLATLSRPQLAPTDPNAQQLLGSARRQSDRLKALIEDLLVVSRLDNRALPQRPTSVDLAQLAHEVVGSLIPGGGPVAYDFPADLPSIEVDQDHLSRVLGNLVENALKYAPESPIEIVGRVNGAEVWLSVVDHGPGIPYELHDHIFERFTQVHDSSTRAGGGTGLGLSIVRGLTEAMGGRVWYEPTIGGGATFVLAFPRSAAAYGMAG